MSDKLDRRNFLLSGAAAVAGLALASQEARAQYGGNATPQPDLFSGINRAGDINNLAPLEQVHVPAFELPRTVAANKPFTLKVTVGQKLHVMERQHHIEWVQVFIGDVWIAQVLFSPVRSQPVADLSLVLVKPAIIRAWELCNLHGLWEHQIEVTF